MAAVAGRCRAAPLHGIPPRRATAAAAGRAARREGEGLASREAWGGRNGNARGDPFRAAWPAHPRGAEPEGSQSHSKERRGGVADNTKSTKKGSARFAVGCHEEPKTERRGLEGVTTQQKKEERKGVDPLARVRIPPALTNRPVEKDTEKRA